MQNKENINNEAWWSDPMKVFMRVSAWIAIPVIAALFFGKLIDEKLGSAPFGFFSIVGFAFLISCYGIFREVLSYIKSTSNDKQ